MLVLAEAAAIPLLEHPSGDRAEIGKATFADIQERMVKPMKAAFQKGDREAGLRAFIGCVEGPLYWDKMPDAERRDIFEHAHEWDVMMTKGELFPELDPAAVRKIQIPALLLSGGKSFPFLNLVDEQLKVLLPQSRRIILPEATHARLSPGKSSSPTSVPAGSRSCPTFPRRRPERSSATCSGRSKTLPSPRHFKGKEGSLR
jgi:pimeloyl-ACP methyl ester carboxylesterase